MPTKAVPAPKSLPPRGRPLWQAVARQWASDGLTPDARERQVLADACAEVAMLGILEDELTAQVAQGRLVVKGSMGQPVTNSLVAECRRSRQAVAALLKQLGMDAPPLTNGDMKGRELTISEAGRRGGLARRGIS